MGEPRRRCITRISTESINRGNLAATQALGNLQGSGFDATQSLAMIDRMINAQAYVHVRRRYLLRVGGHLPAADSVALVGASAARRRAGDAAGAH